MNPSIPAPSSSRVDPVLLFSVKSFRRSFVAGACVVVLGCGFVVAAGPAASESSSPASICVYCAVTTVVSATTITCLVCDTLSWTYLSTTICFRLFLQLLRRAASRACWTAGNSSAIRIAIMAITTNSSINVNPFRFFIRLPLERIKYAGTCSERKKLVEMELVCIMNRLVYCYLEESPLMSVSSS